MPFLFKLFLSVTYDHLVEILVGLSYVFCTFIVRHALKQVIE